MGLSRLCSSPPGVGLEAINATCASERTASLKPSNLAGRCDAHASLQWLTPKMPVKVGHLENMRGKKNWTTILFVALLGILFGGCYTGNLMCGETMMIFRPGNQQLLHGFIGGARKAQTQRQAGTCRRLWWAWSSEVDKNSIVQNQSDSCTYLMISPWYITTIVGLYAPFLLAKSHEIRTPCGWRLAPAAKFAWPMCNPFWPESWGPGVLDTSPDEILNHLGWLKAYR